VRKATLNRGVKAIARDELAERLIELAAPAMEEGTLVRADLPIRTSDRAVGAEIAGEIARRYGNTGLLDDSIVVRFTGSAGQSFGAFAARGLSLDLEGEANDYVGKGLSGGRISIRPPSTARLLANGTPIAGNAVLYGATSGELYLAGAAGERFAVRNSGAIAVVEGVGDHACEYMTGGTVIILGDTGRNLAAGMSGGVVFVGDEHERIRERWSREVMDVQTVAGSEAEQLLRHHLERHVRFTGSRRAKHALARWTETIRTFVRLIPVEYKRALARQQGERESRYG
jgi:glutamate synthase (NADPH/NADH) large chain